MPLSCQPGILLHKAGFHLPEEKNLSNTIMQIFFVSPTIRYVFSQNMCYLLDIKLETQPLVVAGIDGEGQRKRGRAQSCKKQESS